ncbi:TIGR02300 family protein [Azorhizobium doebereinerae]|uniref:TIGR02300 family protein n=1 Tax=Azorhizobium doebereinerae TaxID=281091 RepID=UPI00048C31B7|nr:TIGR02300 family protein [Azorhizobium doebereinerae]
MAKPELGTKRVCPVTGRKFYDLNKDPVVSPFTGESYPRSFFEPAPRAGSRAEARAAVAEEPEVDEVADVEVISLEEAEEETTGAKSVPGADDVDVDEEIDADTDDDTFLEEDEDDGDDVSDLIGEGLEDDEEA